MILPVEPALTLRLRDRPFLTDAGLFQWAVAKMVDLPARPDMLTVVFWTGPRDCGWAPASPRGAAPLHHIRLYAAPEDAERDFLAAYPEYRP